MDDLSISINQEKELLLSSIGLKIDNLNKKLSLDPNNISIIRKLAKYSSKIRMYDLSI